jgi:hypothetical protein
VMGHALNNLGNVYRAQGRWTEAITAYETRCPFHKSCTSTLWVNNV